MTNFTKLLELKDYADAKPILETLPANETRSTLAQTAYQIQETQPNLARNFLKTIIKECEDEEKKIAEVDGGTSHESSSTTGLAKVGENEAVTDAENAVDTKDQMGVPIGEMAPPNGMPSQGVPPQMQPPLQQPPVPQQQMQYTIQEANMIRGQFKAVKEALQALTKEIKETKIESTRSLEIGIGDKGTKSTGKFIRETTTESQATSIKKMNDALNKGTY